MNVSIASVKPRINVQKANVSGIGILEYDDDNAYPQRIARLVDDSTRASACLKWYYKFIFGTGFTDQTFFKTVINDDGETVDKLARKVIRDFSRNHGFAILVNWNANHQIDSLYHIPWEQCRLTLPDDNNYIPKIAIYDNWANTYRFTDKTKRKIQRIDVFNPDPDIIDAQVALAGGWQNYKGQIYWYSVDGASTYPKAIYDAALEDIDSDARAKRYKNKTIRKSFLAQQVFIKQGKFQDDRERNQFTDNMEQFVGEDGATTMIIDTDMPDQVPDIKPFTTNVNDKLFQYTEDSIHDSIRDVFQIPPIILDLVPGRLGSLDELGTAFRIYNKITENERQIFEEEFANIFQYFKEDINPSKDFSIQELTFESEVEATAVPLTPGEEDPNTGKPVVTTPAPNSKQQAFNRKVAMLINALDHVA